MSNDIDSMPGLDKAAILFQVLGESLALTMFTGISESDLLRIRVRSQELKHIPFNDKKAILEEYYFKMMTQKYRQVTKSNKLFTFLINLTDEQIYYLISTESSKVIALSIAQLPEERKLKILDRFDSNLKHNIILDLADLDSIPLEGVVTIAQELKKKVSFLPGPKEFSRGGAQSIASILNQMSLDDAEQYLYQISQDDPELYTEVKKYYLSFDDLLEMPDHLMIKFWRSPDIDPDILAKALKGMDQNIVDNILSKLPKRKQAMYTPLKEPISKSDLEAAQLSILGLAKTMDKNGELNLQDLLSDEEMI